MCEKAGPQIEDVTVVLLRQVYPSWLTEDGEPSSQAFYPWRDIDQGCLSVDHGGLTTAESAHALFTTLPPDGFGMASVGVWGLSVAEVVEVGVSAWCDPVPAADGKPANPAHALVEFEGKNDKARKAAGRVLKVKAIARGRLHPRAA
ncbi:MAG: hypothetical protein QM820_06535 [Minicystis sp.]